MFRNNLGNTKLSEIDKKLLNYFIYVVQFKMFMINEIIVSFVTRLEIMNH